MRTRDREAIGVPRVALQRALDRGQVIRRARGVYATPDHATTRHTDIAGVEKHKIEGVIVQMTNPAKTVADCFRYRDTVGTDVALEALRDCLRKRKATPADIFEMAKVDRVARVMRPYLEALA